MALVVNDRVKETSTTTGTGTFDLAGAATGFQTFVAGVGDTNTTYYAIFNQGTTEWEVGLGTVTDAATDTLARTTVLESSNSDSAVDFAAGTKDVFCTLPASKAVYLDANGNPATGLLGKQEGTNFTGSLLVGHSTTGTLSTAIQNVGIGIGAMDAITSGDYNVVVGYGAGTDMLAGSYGVLIGTDAGANITNGLGNVCIGWKAGEDIVGNNGNTLIGKFAGGNVTGTGNIALGEGSGDNITSGSGNIMIGNVDADSATGSHQLKINGYDGSSHVLWMSGDSSGNVTFAGTATANGSLLATQGDATALAVALG